ncbi:MAG: hypothetical protein HY457_00905 [Parcubacteria group bacterium]|nr:hypothetical protein [Parcubacteria group bacterium]
MLISLSQLIVLIIGCFAVTGLQILLGIKFEKETSRTKRVIYITALMALGYALASME